MIIDENKPCDLRSCCLMVCIAIVGLVAGCAPEVGSRAWCERMDEKAKGDWTVNEADAYVRNCIVRPVN